MAEQGALAVYEQARHLRPPAVFRIHSTAVLLTYSLGTSPPTIWPRFVAHVESHRRTWSVKHWSATLEESSSDNVHAHLMLQFHQRVDVTSNSFAFEGVRPNARPAWCDYMGEAFAKKSPQLSFDRGFFYVWADKVATVRMPGGAVCVAGDYAPVWTGCRKKYKVLRKWPQTLWEAHKLSHDVYDDLLFNTRQGVVCAKRNLEAVRERELEKEEERELAAVTKRIRANEDLYRPFLKVPEAERWLQKFEKDGLRFPILLVLGPSYAAKTEWSKSLFNKPLELKIGPLKHFPEKMRLFHRGVHDGIVLDDIRDLEFLAEHQHILQGKYDERAEFASTPGGQRAFRRWLYRVPFVATANYSTANLEYLRTHDWLKKADNCVVVELHRPPVEAPAGPAPLCEGPHVVPPEAALREWSVADVKVFLCARDLRGIADLCFANGVDGADFANFHEDTLAEELKLTPFQAKKLLGARARRSCPGLLEMAAAVAEAAV